jgi:hypothetical protein
VNIFSGGQNVAHTVISNHCTLDSSVVELHHVDAAPGRKHDAAPTLFQGFICTVQSKM